MMDPVFLTLTAMADELESAALEVVLTPAPTPRHELHAVRVVAMRNPQWYREFCAEYATRRRRPRHSSKPDTMIRRRETLASLGRLIESGGRVRTVYDARLMDAARRYFARNRATLEPLTA